MDDAKQRKQAFAAGYLAGLAGLPLATAPGQETAVPMYAYSGVVHPALPAGYDNKPYATIMFSAEPNVHTLFLSDLPFFAWTGGDSDHFALYNNYPNSGIRFTSFQLLIDAFGNEYWSNIGSQTLSIGYLVAGSAHSAWANYDMYDKSGAVHIRASAAVPVSGNSQRSKAMILGCRLGYVIRAHTGKADVPDGVLLSSDGCILQDTNGLYLIAKEDA